MGAATGKAVTQAPAPTPPLGTLEDTVPKVISCQAAPSPLQPPLLPSKPLLPPTPSTLHASRQEWRQHGP